jgi:molybdopterin converting factor small subunit
MSLIDNAVEAVVSRGGFTRENKPNARKMIRSMRHLGYSNYAAIKDIIDNGNDADASWIKVYVHAAPGDFTITVVDNGVGMDWNTLDEALRLGSDTERNIVSDLGKFGMGLVTASLSICQTVEVITKQKDGPILHSVQDVRVVEEKNDFVKHLDEANEGAKKLFEAMLGGEQSGTVVRLTNCDHISNKDTRGFANKLRKEIGQTYRYFITSEQRRFFVNDQEVAAVDPLMMAEGGMIHSDEQYTINFTNEQQEEQSDVIRVRVALLPDFGIEGNSERGINIPNQGIYLLRNYREIAEGEMFGLQTKHNDLNRVRAEVLFPATLDELMGVDFTKQKPEPKQAVLDKLRQALLPQFRALRGQVKSQRVKVETNDVSHNEAARLIGQKAHLLAKPKLRIEKRKSPTNQGGQRAQGDGTRTRTNASKTQQRKTNLPARFETASMTAAGPIWDAEPEGKTLVITWNVDHPFYQRFILENNDNPSMVSATDFLVYSLAAAELVYVIDDDEDTNEDRRALLENIRATVSNNMRQLLS